MSPIAESKRSEIHLFLNSGHYWNGYDIISTMAHEIGHILDKRSGILTNSSYEANKGFFEKRADSFARNHWSYQYISDEKEEEYKQHAIEYGY